jgi:hypothetical protein
MDGDPENGSPGGDMMGEEGMAVGDMEMDGQDMLNGQEEYKQHQEDLYMHQQQ